jgi:hypothetical protein
MRTRVGLLLFFLVLGIPAGGEEVAIPASRDTSLYHPFENFANGGGAYFFAGRTDFGFFQRAIIGFNIAAHVPAGATIQSAVLTLHLSRTRASFQPVSLHRVTRDWGEGIADASGNEGGGGFAQIGDATWNFAFFNTVPWDTEGGDFIQQASATTSVGDNNAYITWGPTDTFTADIQRWLDLPEENFGWLLKGNESVTVTTKRFDSRQNSNPSRRPTLMVTYTIDVAIPGDADGDGDVDLFDYNTFENCVSGPQSSPASHACFQFDLDADRDVDFSDYALFMINYTG